MALLLGLSLVLGMLAFRLVSFTEPRQQASLLRRNRAVCQRSGYSGCEMMHDGVRRIFRQLNAKKWSRKPLFHRTATERPIER